MHQNSTISVMVKAKTKRRNLLERCSLKGTKIVKVSLSKVVHLISCYNCQDVTIKAYEVNKQIYDEFLTIPAIVILGYWN